MKSDVIMIINDGTGFEKAVNETKKIAEYQQLDKKGTLHLQLMTEEMLSLARSVTGEMQASFWLEADDGQYTLHMSTKTLMDKEKRQQLIASSTSRKNEAANSFLGFLRNAFEEAMAVEHNSSDDIPYDVMSDLPMHLVHDNDWDGYERSVLRKVADDVKISIRGGVVDMTVSKDFSKETLIYSE